MNAIPQDLQVAPFRPWAQGVGIHDGSGKEVARVRHRKDLNCYDTARAIVAAYNAGSAETIAYIAIGARDALSDLPQPLHNSLVERCGGEMGAINEAIAHASLLDRMFTERAENFGAVFCYEIAEPFGAAFIRALAADPCANAEAIARQVFADAREL